MAGESEDGATTDAAFCASTVDWQDLQIFLAVAEGGSMRAAARKFSAHQSTISRRVGKLEHQVGGKLITRNGTGCAACNLTPRGRDVLSVAKGIEQRINKLLS